MDKLEASLYLHFGCINTKLYEFFDYEKWDEAISLIEDYEKKISATSSLNKKELLISRLKILLQPLLEDECKESYYQIGVIKSGLTLEEYKQKKKDFFLSRWKLSINKPKRIREFIAGEHKGRATIIYHNDFFRCEDVICGSFGEINLGNEFNVPHHKDGDVLVFKIK